MAKPLSFDLRSRVLAAVDGGLSCRQAAERFGVSASSAIRWAALRRKVGDARPKAVGGDRLSSRTEAHAGLIHAALAETSDITLPELKEKLAAHGAHVSVAALWRFCRRHKITRKKETAHASEQDRPDILTRRETWFDGRPTSTRTGSSSSTRPGLRPIWRGATAGPQKGSVCRSSINPALGEQGPGDAGILVRQRDDDEHRRLAREHSDEP